MANERENWRRGDKRVNYYEECLENSRKNPLGQGGSGEMKKIITPEDMPWEESKQGMIKHLINQKMCEAMNIPAKSVDLYMQEIPPGGYSGKHRHMSEECVYIVEGKGHDVHWDVDIELKEKYRWIVNDQGERYDWEAGDLVYIPTNIVHQHFNDHPTQPARIISAVNRVYNHLGFGYNDLIQMEYASDYEE